MFLIKRRDQSTESKDSMPDQGPPTSAVVVVFFPFGLAADLETH